MHAKPNLRVEFEPMITFSGFTGSVILDVMLLIHE